MPAARSSLSRGSTGAGWLGWWRLDVVKLGLLALPALVLDQLLLGFATPVADSPAAAAVLFLPLLVVVVALAWRLRGERPLALGPRYLFFFLAYCLLFSLAAGSELLRGERELLAGYDDQRPANFLGLDRLGDWHYAVAPAAPPADDLLIVTFPSFAGELREEVRRNFFFLIRKALAHEAKGMAFDYFLAQPSQADPLLRSVLGEAERAGLPVLFAEHHANREGTIVIEPIAPELAAVIPPGRRGHVAAYLESDGRVRSIPIELPGLSGRPALSLRIATLLAGREVAVPASRLAQFLAPRGGMRVLPFAPDADWELMRGRFILVGTASANDVRETPFGPLAGVVIHAYTAQGLRTAHLVRRLGAGWSFPVVFVLGFWLTVLKARGFPRRTLLATFGVFAAAIVAGAALAMALGRIWIDVSYPLVALGGLCGLLVAGWALPVVRPRSAAKVPVVAEPAAQPAGFDVFLSHNSDDKARVREIAEALAARGLRPWLDEEQLTPGRSWQEGLEEILATVRSSAVFVGGEGLGPWEVPEMRTALSEGVRRGLPVIPVLLPGAPAVPVLPLFLTQYTWVDLRQGLTEEGLDRLVWGITGTKPERAPGARAGLF